MEEDKENQVSSPTCDALLVYCSDFRFWRTVFNFVLEGLKISNFDILCYPGSTANLCRDIIQSHLFMEKIKFLHDRHKFHTIVLANHTDCGGYGGKESFNSPEAEKQAHITDMMSAKSRLMSEFPHMKILAIYIDQTAETPHVQRIL